MLRTLRTVLRDGGREVRGRVFGLAALLIGFNVGTAAVALVAFHGRPVLLGTALLAYGFGLRHAVDADHIAAIDTVTRKLMQEGKRPVGTGFFFSVGHSVVLVIATVLIALLALRLRDGFQSYNAVANAVGTVVSGVFLLAMAVLNLAIARGVWQAWARVRRGGALDEAGMASLLARRGLIARVLRPLFGMVRHSWMMLPVGFLFGLGFDTATEVSLLTVAATQASHGLSVWSILVFPALFSAGMSLVDTADGILMLGAYGWAFVRPVRKLYYNLTITLVSAVVALVIGGIETLGLAASTLELKGWFWDRMGSLADHFGLLGYAIIGVFAGAWVVSAAVWRWRRFDEMEIGSV